MKKSFRILSLVFVIIISSLSGCGKDELTINYSAQEAKIGLNLELTGPLAYYGKGTLNGVLMAFDEINAAGVNEIKITPIVADNKSDAARAVSVANRLITQNDVVTTIGPGTSFNFIVTIPTAMQYKIPTVSSTASANQVTVDANGNVYEYVFRVCINESLQGSTMATFALDNLNAKKAVTIVEENNVYSEDLTNTFIKAYETGGGTIVSNEIYQKGDSDFNAILTKIKQEDFDVIFLPAYYREAGLIIKQTRKMGITSPILASASVDSPILLEIAGPEALNDVYLITDYPTLNQDSKIQKFISDYKEKYGVEPTSVDARGYDTGYFIADAIKRAGSTNPEALKNAYAFTENFSGVTGTFSMGEDHNPMKSMWVICLVNGVPSSSVEVKPLTTSVTMET